MTPRAPATCRSTRRLWAARAAVHASSPSCAARSVDPTMSVNNTVDSTRFDGVALRWPVRNDSTSSSTRSASPASHMLSSPSSSTSRACRILLARSCACSPRTFRSPRRCSSSVGAWMLSSAGRTSVRTNTSYNALKYPGPPESRSPRAHQRPAWRRRPPSWAPAGRPSHRSRPCARSCRRISPGPTQACRTVGRRRAGSARTGYRARVSARGADGSRSAA